MNKKAKIKTLPVVVFLVIAFFSVLGSLTLYMLIRKENFKEDARDILKESGTNHDSKTQEKIIPQNDLIRITFPASGEKVGGNINVTGIAKGVWYFEGEFPVDMVDLAGNRLADASALAEGEWMTEDFVPFSATLKYAVHDKMEAKLIIQRNNPSDLEKNHSSVEIPITLEPGITSAKLFFSSQHLDNAVSICDKVFPVSRSGYETTVNAKQVLEDLLAGPTEKEKDLGYKTSIPQGVKIQNFEASSNVAKVDLSKELLDIDVDVACRRILMKTQIEETIKNAGGVKDVIITVNRKPFPGKFPDEGPSGSR